MLPPEVGQLGPDALREAILLVNNLLIANKEEIRFRCGLFSGLQLVGKPALLYFSAFLLFSLPTLSPWLIYLCTTSSPRARRIYSLNRETVLDAQCSYATVLELT